MPRTLPALAALVVGLGLAFVVSGGSQGRAGPGPAAKRPADSERLLWPQFLGPRRDGVSRETGLNLDWDTKKPPVRWKVPLGPGFSSLIVVGDRLYTMAQRGRRDVVVCLEAATGKEVWACDAAPAYVDTQRQGPGPRSTPTYDRGRLYCFLPAGELVCVRADDGKRLWRVDTLRATGERTADGEYFYWGLSLSPLVVGGRVLVQAGDNKQGTVAAFNTDSGELAWKAGRDPIEYASPILVTVAGRRQVVFPTGRSILGLDPDGGAVLWRYPFGNKFNVTGSNPVWADDTLFVSAAYGGGCAALEILPKGDGWQVREKWKSKKALQTLFATSIAHGGHLYGVHGDIGAILLRCLDLKTGDLKWDRRWPSRSTLLGVDGHLLVLDERGTLYAVEMDPRRCVVKCTLPDVLAYKAWAAPALAEGLLYLRDQRHVVCLDLRKQ
jgi:outer membrane protein assembly factor BamB